MSLMEVLLSLYCLYKDFCFCLKQKFLPQLTQKQICLTHKEVECTEERSFVSYLIRQFINVLFKEKERNFRKIEDT